MFRLSCRLPRQIAIAVSGGVDSMVALHFFSRNHDVTVYHVDHGTEHGAEAKAFVQKELENYDIVDARFSNKPGTLPSSNKESFWRKHRYDTFWDWCGKDFLPIVLGHHLDDAVETYLMSCLTGTPKHIELRGPSNTVRPFLFTSKEDIISYAVKNNIRYLEDPSNKDKSYKRNLIREEVMPVVLKSNIGFSNMVRRKLEVMYAN